jgi:hypothetical protein
MEPRLHRPQYHQTLDRSVVQPPGCVSSALTRADQRGYCAAFYHFIRPKTPPSAEMTPHSTSESEFVDGLLVLLRHKFVDFAGIVLVQHGHR